MTRPAHLPRDPAAAAEVFFDGVCPVCRREIGIFREFDGIREVTFTDVSDPAFAHEALGREAALARFHVRREDGELVSGARAFVAMWRRSPTLRPLARVLGRRPMVDALELGYRAFLTVRVLWRRPGGGGG